MTANEARNAYQRAYRKKFYSKEENRLKRNAYQRKWKHNNPEKVKEYNRRYWGNLARRMETQAEGNTE